MKELMKGMQETLQNSLKLLLQESIKQIKDQMISIDIKIGNMKKQLLENM